MPTDITTDTLVADIAAAHPSTVEIFQRHEIEFCCKGRVPLSEACRLSGLDPATLIAELEATLAEQPEATDWSKAPLDALVQHIQARYHEPLRTELPRLSAMLARVIERHGAGQPETLLPLGDAFHRLSLDLLHHIHKEDAVLFPAIAAVQAAASGASGEAPSFGWISQPIAVMEAEHASADDIVTEIRTLTSNYTPPEWACPTYRGLFFGLSRLDQELEDHVRLENEILFRRAVELAAETGTDGGGGGSAATQR